MRLLTTSQLNVLNGATDGGAAIMGEAFIDASVLRLSTLPYDYTDPDGKVWTGAAGVLEYGETSDSMTLNGEPLNVTWSGASPELISAARDARILNSVFNQYLYLFDTSGNQVGDPIQLYAGFCETPDIDPDPANPKISVDIEGDSITLRIPNVYRMTPERLKRDAPTDTFFDFVAGLQDKEITTS